MPPPPPPRRDKSASTTRDDDDDDEDVDASDDDADNDDDVEDELSDGGGGGSGGGGGARSSFNWRQFIDDEAEQSDDGIDGDDGDGDDEVSALAPAPLHVKCVMCACGLVLPCMHELRANETKPGPDTTPTASPKADTERRPQCRPALLALVLATIGLCSRLL
jgi:hypothetical protein